MQASTISFVTLPLLALKYPRLHICFPKNALRNSRIFYAIGWLLRYFIPFIKLAHRKIRRCRYEEMCGIFRYMHFLYVHISCFLQVINGCLPAGFTDHSKHARVFSHHPANNIATNVLWYQPTLASQPGLSSDTHIDLPDLNESHPHSSS
jgi:hypothetical protein